MAAPQGQSGTIVGQLPVSFLNVHRWHGNRVPLFIRESAASAPTLESRHGTPGFARFVRLRNCSHFEIFDTSRELV
jgi:hypothetical protein